MSVVFVRCRVSIKRDRGPHSHTHRHAPPTSISERERGKTADRTPRTISCRIEMARAFSTMVHAAGSRPAYQAADTASHARAAPK